LTTLRRRGTWRWRGPWCADSGDASGDFASGGASATDAHKARVGVRETDKKNHGIRDPRTGEKRPALPLPLGAILVYQSRCPPPPHLHRHTLGHGGGVTGTLVPVVAPRGQGARDRRRAGAPWAAHRRQGSSRGRGRPRPLAAPATRWPRGTPINHGSGNTGHGHQILPAPFRDTPMHGADSGKPSLQTGAGGPSLQHADRGHNSWGSGQSEQPEGPRRSD